MAAPSFTDITEFKHNEQLLLEAKQTLEQRVTERTQALSIALQAEAAAKLAAEQANATKTRFVAAASHDLLQPLNAARLFASALSNAPTDADSVREIAGRIEGSLRAAEEVLDDMLDIARLESGSTRAEITVFALDDVFTDLERQFAPVAARRNLRLHIRRTRLHVRSDRVLLRRLLQNLVSNACATQRGGVVVGCRRHGGRIEVQVWDTGPGIAEQHRKVVFDEFRGLDRPSPWGEKGLGLGLSICDRIARVLQLDLSLRSEVGRGSMFSVQLEVTATPASVLAAEPAPASPASLVGGTVLCVDDENAILDGMQTLLERWGLRVLRASTAEEARSAFMQHSPDVVLADYRLGDDDCDGLELLQSLRAGGVAYAPAALVTADHGAEVAERARLLGYKVLRKPVKPAALRGLLGALLASASRG
ncbi:MAG: hybrid sensor histidine kinase/response regulator [Proteobacteria bacterium]|nr:hybrid sensor histidine kinase/response regulator [Pseudomonadota bacterium]